MISWPWCWHRLRRRRIEVQAAVLINEDARLRALRATFLLLTAISLLAIFPALKLPNYTPGELPIEDILKNDPLGNVTGES